MRMFAEFEALLGPVGAAKALHLLAPRFFPPESGHSRGCRVPNSGPSLARTRRGLEFMKVNKDEVVDLGGEGRCGTDVLKRLDELNYCYARGWL